MQFVINQTLLAGAVGAANPAVSPRTVNPVLGHFRLRLEGNTLWVTGTDGDFTIVRQVQLATIAGVDGDVLVPAGLLKQLVDRLPAGKDISVSLDGNQLNLKVARSNYDLTCLGPENFPELPDFSQSKLATIPASVLKRSFEQVGIAAVKESSSGGAHYTNGVCLDFKGGSLNVVATDGHRLSLKRNSGLSGMDGVERALLPPARVIDALAKMLPDDEEMPVELYLHGNQLFFAFGANLVGMTLLDVRFPDYERVIPNQIEAKIHTNREDLLGALNRVLLVCRQKDQNPVARLRCTAQDVLQATSEAGELGKGTEEVTCEVAGWDGHGDGIKVGLNPSYLMDAMKVLSGDQVTLNWISEIQPVMLTSSREPDFTYIVMPIRMD